MIHIFQIRNIDEPLTGFIGYCWNWTMFGKPCIFINHLFGHGLFEKYHIIFVQPMRHFQCSMLILPALIDIRAKRDIRYRSDRLNNHPVGIKPKLHFEDLKILRRSEEHTSELQSRENLVCRLLLEKKK